MLIQHDIISITTTIKPTPIPNCNLPNDITFLTKSELTIALKSAGSIAPINEPKTIHIIKVKILSFLNQILLIMEYLYS